MVVAQATAVVAEMQKPRWVYCWSKTCGKGGMSHKLFQLAPDTDGILKGTVFIKCKCGSINIIELGDVLT